MTNDAPASFEARDVRSASSGQTAAGATRGGRRLVQLVHAAGLGLVIAVIHMTGLTLAVDKRNYDLWFQVASRSDDAARHVVIVAIDDRSVGQDSRNRWPWPSSRLGDLLSKISGSRPAAIGLDLLLDRPRDETDAELGQVLAECQNVVVAADLQGGEESDAGADLRWPLSTFLPPDPSRVGFANFVADRPDGFVRSVRLAIVSGDRTFYSFPYLVALTATKGWSQPTQADSNWVVLRELGGGVSTWPVNTRIDFRRPGRIPAVSAIDVLEGRIPSGVMAGKAVLVGGTAAGAFRDLFRTPFYDDLVTGRHSGMHGVEIQANAIETLLAGLRVGEARPTVLAAAIFLFALFACALLRVLRPVVGLLAVAVLVTASALACLALFGLYRLQVPLMPFALGVAGAYVVVGLEKYAVAEDRRRRDRAMFEALEFYRDRVFHKMSSEVMLTRYALEECSEAADSVAGRLEATTPAIGLRHVDTLSDYLDNLHVADIVRKEEAAPELESVDLAQLALGAQQEFLRAYGRAGLTLEVKVSEAPVTVLADPAQIRVAVDTILENALKYVPTTGESVEMRCFLDGEYGVLEIADDGPGMSAEGLRRVFDPFFRERTARTERAKGMGLGLFIAKSIIDKHRGSLRAESELGEGTRFLVRLRLSRQSGGRKESDGRRL
jgi:CHASE2 domain-containing sensor protein/anti-sigma regulatory factor (Ser/Thr protein kinase)